MAETFGLNWLASQVDEDFEPGVLPGKLESLIDGDYDFEVSSASFKLYQAKNMCLIQMELEVMTPGKHHGAKVQHSLFLTDKESAARVGRDLETLGFDCKNWKVANGRPFSQEVQKVAKVMKGLRFAGKKQTNASGGKTYHNLYIKGRLPGDGKPEVIGPELLNAADPDDPFASIPA